MQSAVRVFEAREGVDMKHVSAMCAMVLLLGSVTARGQETAAAEKAEPGDFSVDLSLTIPSSYVFRGYVSQDERFIVQPEAILTFNTMVGGLSVSPYVGAWANFTDVKAPGEPNCFNELDLYAGADIELEHGFTLGFIYTCYMSPGNAFDDIHEVGVMLTHDDPLNPSAGIYRELCNQNGDENTYIELGLKPGFDVPNVDKLRLDFPLLMGLSPDEYYTDSDGDGEWIGYLSAAVQASYALNDNVTLVAGLEYWYLHADSTQESNNGDENQFVGSVGVKFSK
jgi:uncharacterized protein (TIGR02001 family)